MRFSGHPGRRRDQVLEILFACVHDEEDRRRFYDVCKQRYLFGGGEFTQARVNKISPIINRKSAFAFSPDSLKFWMQIIPDEDIETVLPMVEAAGEALEDEWWRSDTDRLFGLAVTWAYVNGPAILYHLPEKKTDGNVGITAHLINPADFGVITPSQPDILKQPAMSMTSYLDEYACLSRLRFHPKRNYLLSKLELYNQNRYAEGMITMGYSQTQTNYKAEYAWSGPYRYQPRSPLNYYRWRDLYAFDDNLGDWRVFTLTSDEIVFDRPMAKIGLPGIPPFSKICPIEHPEYFWGISQAETLGPTQEWFTYRMDELDQFVAKRLKTPKAIIGAPKNYEERMAALNRPGGRATLPRDAKVQEMSSEIPQQIFEFMEGIDAFFLEQSGLRPSMFGKQEPGIRTEGMAASTMRLAAAEMRREALVIEKQAENAANILFGLMRRYYDTTLMDDNNVPFKIGEFPAGARVRVDGHSGSPLFVEDHAQIAQTLRRYDDITSSRFIELLHPAMKGALIHDAKKLQWVKALAAQVAKKQQEMKRIGKDAAQ